MQFDSIYASAGTGKIKMYIRNVGGVDLNLSKIYVNGVDTANNTGTLDGYSLAVQAVAYLEANCTMTNSYFYEVTVTCKGGTSVSQSVQAK